MIPAAAVAVIRAAIEDTHLAELAHRPGHTATRIAKALEAAGWNLTTNRPENTSNKAA
ncbi:MULTISPECIES: hypothetical protein [Streptomyces]|uniref:hypothetical protein n=1 Tax=Streptomyces TaxID=1883 RepID=UPI00142E3B7F|nr:MULTISPECIES: hypothetical protein [Streptomyces]